MEYYYFSVLIFQVKLNNLYICKKIIIMYKIFENPTKIFTLTKEGTRELYDNLYNEMIEKG
ncbi:MAG: hypothetical protein PWQ43_759, partial [Rikenellaceae bacterium]|nr:hypothetical protein [Rikenellaceae bacterium]MDN5355817.1 hypothetical protein [Rikenellaceae bacterium]